MSKFARSEAKVSKLLLKSTEFRKSLVRFEYPYLDHLLVEFFVGSNSRFAVVLFEVGWVAGIQHTGNVRNGKAASPNVLPVVIFKLIQIRIKNEI